MILKLALRNLLHDRIRFAATLVGLVFSTSLVTIQLGLYASSERMIATLIDRSDADLWIVPLETRSFENGATLPGRERHLALSTPGIAAATEVVVSFAEWRKPSGGVVPVVLVGAEPGNGGPARGTSPKAPSRPSPRPMPLPSTARTLPTSASAGSATKPKSSVLRHAWPR